MQIQREPLDTCFFRLFLQVFDLTLIDFGANHGEFTTAALPSRDSTAKLIDANYELQKRTKKRVEKLGFFNLDFISGCVGADHTKSLYLCFEKSHTGAAEVTSDFHLYKSRGCICEPVNSLSPHDYIDKRIKYAAKIDIEGLELDLLKELWTAQYLSSILIVGVEATYSSQLRSIYNHLAEFEFVLYASNHLWYTGSSLIDQFSCCYANIVNNRFDLKPRNLSDVALSCPFSMVYFINKRLLECSLASKSRTTTRILHQDFWGVTN
ncbi:hypothetical protein [Synechococcus sp. CC9311]|uniref:hypothetical protein n=1 Tax=Synechococcus sp. (strain CC9311) TaxID=64471 RepID=UPI00059BBAB9|nr:hypothetical protein [Synechococcus sp. CC9311]